MNIKVLSFRHAEFEMVVGYAKKEKARRIQKIKPLMWPEWSQWSRGGSAGE